MTRRAAKPTMSARLRPRERPARGGGGGGGVRRTGPLLSLLLSPGAHRGRRWCCGCLVCEWGVRIAAPPFGCRSQSGAETESLWMTSSQSPDDITPGYSASESGFRGEVSYEVSWEVCRLLYMGLRISECEWATGWCVRPCLAYGTEPTLARGGRPARRTNQQPGGEGRKGHEPIILPVT